MIDVKVENIRVTSRKSLATESLAMRIAEMFNAGWPEGFGNQVFVDFSDGHRQAEYKVVVEK